MLDTIGSELLDLHVSERGFRNATYAYLEGGVTLCCSCSCTSCE